MFVRIKKHPATNKATVLVCHTKRFEKHTKQIILCKIGTSNDPQQVEQMRDTAEQIIKQLKKQEGEQSQQMPNIPLLMDAQEINRLNTGIKDIVGTLYDRLGFNNILKSNKMKEILKAVVLARFTEPSSKLKASSILQRKFSLEYSEDSIYRMMDALFQASDQVKQTVFASTVATIGKQIDLMFFDVSTLYFETIEEDELRQFGFSKDFRFNTTQVVLALATTCNGLPIGYKLFPGNTAEVTTLINCVKEWKKQIGIREAIVVADRGMMSDNNLKQLIAEGMSYVVACPMRKLPQKDKVNILEADGYKCTVINQQMTWQKEVKLSSGNRLIVTYNQKRHDKDQKERDRLIKKIEKRLGPNKKAKKLISNQGYIKYIEIDGTTTAELNTEKIAEEAKWDGLHGVMTNTELTAEEIVTRYKQLLIIEESFRVNKHNLKMRPIYHFTPKRIYAHIAICFLTYALVRQIQHILKQHNLDLSIETIREELLDVQASIIADTTTCQLYKMPSHIPEEIKEVYKIFGLEAELKIRPYLVE